MLLIACLAVVFMIIAAQVMENTDMQFIIGTAALLLFTVVNSVLNFTTATWAKYLKHSFIAYLAGGAVLLISSMLIGAGSFADHPEFKSIYAALSLCQLIIFGIILFIRKVTAFLDNER